MTDRNRIIDEPRYEIQIKQRGGKWVFWCYCGTETDMRATWAGIGALRRKARLVDHGTVIDKYEPPEICK